MSDASVSVYNFTDYRRFMGAWFEERAGHPSRRGFSKQVHCSSTLITLIINGERDLSQERGELFCQNMPLDEEETRYFLDLVTFNQTGSRTARQNAWERIQVSRQFRTANRVTEHTYELFARWYNAAIAELARCVGWRAEPEWIAQTLIPSITAEAAAEALTTLETLGILVRDGQGALVASTEHWVTDHEVTLSAMSLGLYKQHTWMLSRAEKALEEFDWAERHFSVSIMAISEGNEAALRKLITRFQEEAMQLSLATDQPNARVVSLSVQQFPLTSGTLPES
ncbi:MAG: hypothetical protein ACI8S6_005844 [Myxococcota bacterium]|jgi:uncharacterized protein (TIGR02147 family)